MLTDARTRPYTLHRAAHVEFSFSTNQLDGQADTFGLRQSPIFVN